jgi:hypothetical protein
MGVRGLVDPHASDGCSECRRQSDPAISDQFRALSQDASMWISENPCSVTDLAVSFTTLVQSYGTAADSLEAEANGADWPAINREFAGLHDVLEGAETLSPMSDQAGRQAAPDPDAYRFRGPLSGHSQPCRVRGESWGFRRGPGEPGCRR